MRQIWLLLTRGCFWQFLGLESLKALGVNTMSPKMRGHRPKSSHSWMIGEGRSPIKHTMSVLLSDFEYFIEKKYGLSARVWISIFNMPKLLLGVQIFGAKSTKKCYHVGILEAFYL